MDFWESIKFRYASTSGVHILYFSSLMPPSFLIFFNNSISLFFCLVVGSSGMTLYVSSFTADLEEAKLDTGESLSKIKKNSVTREDLS